MFCTFMNLKEFCAINTISDAGGPLQQYYIAKPLHHLAVKNHPSSLPLFLYMLGIPISGLSPEKKSRVVKMCVLSSSSHVEPQSCDYRMLQLSIAHAQTFRLIPLEQAVDPK